MAIDLSGLNGLVSEVKTELWSVVRSLGETSDIDVRVSTSYSQRSCYLMFSQGGKTFGPVGMFPKQMNLNKLKLDGERIIGGEIPTVVELVLCEAKRDDAELTITVHNEDGTSTQKTVEKGDRAIRFKIVEDEDAEEYWEALKAAEAANKEA